MISDPTRFRPIPPELFVGAKLSKSRAPVTGSSLARDLRSYLDRAGVQAALERLVGSDDVEVSEEKHGLTDKGRARFRGLLGKDASDKWDKIRVGRFGMMALGGDPEDAAFRRRYGTTFVPMVVAVAHGLPRPLDLTGTDVANELIARVLKANLPESLLGRGALPRFEIGTLERRILAGIAGAPANAKIQQALGALAGQALGARETAPKALREALVRLALGGTASEGAAPRTATTEDGTPPTLAPPVDGFAQRVLEVARGLTRGFGGPYGVSVPIASVYDAYGRDHPDAGTLGSFKARLVAATEAGALALVRLDLPDLLDAELRSRSATKYGMDDHHFIDTTARSSHV